MATDLEPLEGYWYYDREHDRRFEVIAVDEIENRIDIQDFDGDLDEISFDLWSGLTLEIAEPPEEWRGPMDNLEDLDPDLNDTAASDGGAGNSMERYRREQLEWAGKAHPPTSAGERRRQPRPPR